jgi:hypothetical protein
VRWKDVLFRNRLGHTSHTRLR